MYVASFTCEAKFGTFFACMNIDATTTYFTDKLLKLRLFVCWPNKHSNRYYSQSQRIHLICTHLWESEERARERKRVAHCSVAILRRKLSTRLIVNFHLTIHFSVVGIHTTKCRHCGSTGVWGNDWATTHISLAEKTTKFFIVFLFFFCKIFYEKIYFSTLKFL